LKLLVVNDFVRNGGGTDAVVAAEIAALRQRGHTVEIVARDNRAFDGARGFDKAVLYVATLYSWGARREIAARLDAARRAAAPFDLVHVHNVVPLLGGAVYDACRAAGVTVVQHLHNYRAVCLSSYMERGGRHCANASAAGLVRCAAGRCYRDSLPASAGLAAARLLDRVKGRPFGFDADWFVAPSEHVRRRHIEFGLPAARIVVVPNPARDLATLAGEHGGSVAWAAAGPAASATEHDPAALDGGARTADDPAVPSAAGAGARPYLVYVGALVPEKGVDDVLVLAAGLPEFDVHLLGEGPRRDALVADAARRGLANVHLHGFLDGPAKARLWAGAFLTLVPSRWEEPFGIVAAESLSLGVPVLTSGSGGLREIVRDGCGWIADFSRPEAVAALVRDLWQGARRPDHDAARRAARARYEAEYALPVFAGRLEAALVTATGASAADPAASTASRDPADSRARAASARAATTSDAARGRRLRIALVGTRGVPAAYSGFETAVENLGLRLAARGHDVVVYCRPHMVEGRYTTYKGMRLVYLSTITSKHLDTFAHTFLSTLHMGLFRRRDVAIYFIAGNAPFAGLSRLLGIPSAINVDGLDSRRAKWGGPARRYIRWAEHNAPRLAGAVITDSRVLQRIYADEHGAETTYIPYGADMEPVADAAERLAALGRELGIARGLTPGKYILFVGRLVPENNAHVLVEAFGQLAARGELPPGLDLVVVGDAAYSDDYITGLHEQGQAIETAALAGGAARRSGAAPPSPDRAGRAANRILFTGYQFGETYRALVQHCTVFAVPTEVGGTHPVLVEAMAAGACVVVNDHEPNMETIGDAGASYAGAEGAPALARTLAGLLRDPGHCDELRAKAAKRAQKLYSWDAVTDTYERLARDLTAPRAPRTR
jgi:glycosyltransferase involved in cell wall biosynthesis